MSIKHQASIELKMEKSLFQLLPVTFNVRQSV